MDSRTKKTNNKRFVRYSEVIDGKLEGETALRYIKKYGIVPADILVKAYAMSEGQRQKVVFCKWMLKGCKILIMDNANGRSS